MPYIRETCIAGKTIEIEKKFSSRFNNHGIKRSPNMNKTPEDVAKVNERNAEKELRRKVNHNFKPGDLHLVNTYSGKEPNLEEAKKDIEEFIRKIRNLFRSQGKVLKWISVTEYKNKRIHHHLIINAISVNDLIKYWPKGHIRPSFLDSTGNYKKLAAYLIKETSKTFRFE